MEATLKHLVWLLSPNLLTTLSALTAFRIAQGHEAGRLTCVVAIVMVCGDPSSTLYLPCLCCQRSKEPDPWTCSRPCTGMWPFV
eukprot:3300042-Amphidinium_carterae.1